MLGLKLVEGTQFKEKQLTGPFYINGIPNHFIYHVCNVGSQEPLLSLVNPQPYRSSSCLNPRPLHLATALYLTPASVNNSSLNVYLYLANTSVSAYML
jgi:hypothetical protein